MGPNPLWLLEELCKNIDLKPGIKVLDMGCGKGLTSVTACYDIPDPKELWMPWAVRADASGKLDESDVDFLNADTNNDLELIAMTAVKK